MKRFILLSTTFIISCLLCYSQSNENKLNDKKLPVITFEKKIHDYGTIKQGANGVCEFVFKNTGKEPLQIKNVKSSCGCTVPQWTKEPVKRNKKGVIKVKYNTKIVGNFSKSITVYSNAKNSPLTLRIKGKVVKGE